MHKQLGLVLICVSALLALGQTLSAKYQPGTITAVTKHKNAPGEVAKMWLVTTSR